MGESKFLTAEQILRAKDQQFRTVEVPEWGGAVRIRGLSGSERDAYEQSLLREKGGNQTLNFRNARAKLVALCAVDAEGNRLFTDEHVLELGRKSALAVERVYRVARDLAGLTNEDLDELTKNSDGAPSDGSTSA
jgi:hypothetical protein